MDYIRFIDLDKPEPDPDVGDLTYVFPDATGLESGDYFSQPIFVDSGIPVGARDELTTKLYVCV